MALRSHATWLVGVLFAAVVAPSNRANAAEGEGALPPADQQAVPPNPAPPPNPVPPPAYDSIAAGQEAYQRGRQERLDALGRQLETIDRNAWLSGQPTLYPYLSLGAVYAYGGRRAYRGAASAVPTAPRYGYPPAAFRLSVFEPWPIVPGDIYGYPHLDRAPQPIGHEISATERGGSIYRPVYPAPVTPPAASGAPRSLPAAVSVPNAPPAALAPPAPTDAPSFPAPESIAAPPPVPAGSGPREF